MTGSDKDKLQEQLHELHTMVLQQVTGMDGPAARHWMDDAVDEAYSETPRASMLKIFLGEVRKKAPYSTSIAEKIAAIEQLFDGSAAPYNSA